MFSYASSLPNIYATCADGEARRLSDRCWLCGLDAAAIIYQGWLHGSHRYGAGASGARKNAVSDGAPGGGGVAGDEVELVRGAGVKVELDGYAGLAEAQGVGEVFVAEHVELRDLGVGGRQRGLVGDAGRGGVGGGCPPPPAAL
jgi:hypothetical protein